MRAVVSDNEDHTVADQLLRGGERLLGIAEVIRCHDPHLLAEHAAGGVNVGHCQVRGTLQLLSEPGILASHWACHADQDLARAGQPKVAAVRQRLTEPSVRNES